MPVTAEHELYRRLVAGHRGGPAPSLGRRPAPAVAPAAGTLAAVLHRALLAAHPVLAGQQLATALAHDGVLTPIGALHTGHRAPLDLAHVPAGAAAALIWADVDAACAAAGPAGYGQALVRAGVAASVLAAAGEGAGLVAELDDRPRAGLTFGAWCHLSSVVLRVPVDG